MEKEVRKPESRTLTYVFVHPVWRNDNAIHPAGQ